MGQAGVSRGCARCTCAPLGGYGCRRAWPRPHRRQIMTRIDRRAGAAMLSELEASPMGCLLVMLGAFFPRLAVLFIWLARPIYFDAAINSFIIALLGILFVPF